MKLSFLSSKTRGCFRLLLLTAEILSYLYVVDEISRGFPEMIIWEYWYFFYTKSINLFFQNKPSTYLKASFLYARDESRAPTASL